MNREEKNLQSRQKIIDFALREFGRQGYGLSSINTICKEGEISKGNLYHYFEDKDQLYLTCIAECFDALTAHLKKELPPAAADGRDVETNLEAYFHARLGFFEQNPLYLRLFCEAVVSPPAPVAQQIHSAKQKFDDYNVSVLTALLQSVTLQPGTTLTQVVEVFRLYQDFVNAKFQMVPTDQDSLKRHDEVCKRSIHILLYGVVERRAEQ